jgi:hypothetical protein
LPLTLCDAVLLEGGRETLIDHAVDELEPVSDRTLISHTLRLDIPAPKMKELRAPIGTGLENR